MKLSAQREIIHRSLNADDELLGEFVEVEPGKQADLSWQRPLPKPNSREPDYSSLS